MDIDDIPRLGWLVEPSPVSEVASLAEALGLGWLGVKRDDLLPGLHGSTKVRKLDTLLAAPPWRDAPAWMSVGALGSGHLVSCVAAAHVLGRELHAHLFWQQPGSTVLDNLAVTAAGATSLRWSRSRVRMVLGRPSLGLAMLRDARPARVGGALFIPPGATTPAALVGVVRAGLELASQVRAGALPAPEHLYVALGSGGTAAGLAVGLGLAGLDTTVHCVSVVESALSSNRRLRGLVRGLVHHLEARGCGRITPAPWTVVRGFVGQGYGVPTLEGRRACTVMARHGVPLEPTYTGKALAGLMAAAPELRGARVLFWNTRRGPLPPPPPHWRDKLPADLRRALDGAGHRSNRRLFLFGAGAATALALTLNRFGGYAEIGAWRGHTLGIPAAHVLIAAAEAVLLPSPPRPVSVDIAQRVDDYVTRLPPAKRDEIAMLFPAIEHGTFLGGHLSRFTELSHDARREHLRALRAMGGLAAAAARGLRDLVMIGAYQRPEAWEAMGYDGPMMPAEPRAIWEPYASMVAPPGQLPPGAAL